MLHTLLSRQFWPGNISPGHHSSGPILKLRRCEGIPWLERVVIYCCDSYSCCKTENGLSAFSCLVVQRAMHQVACCWSLAVPVYGGGCRAKLQDVVGWHLPMDLADVSLWCAASRGGREVPVGSWKRQWECTRYAPAERARTGKPWQGWVRGKGALPLPCQRSLWGVVVPICYILLLCQRQFWSDINIDLDIRDQILWPWHLYQLFQTEPH